MKVVKNILKKEELSKIICRMFASWLILSMIFLPFNNINPDYLINIDKFNLNIVCLIYILIYLILLIISSRFNCHADSFMLLISFLLCSILWLLKENHIYFIMTLILILFVIIMFCLFKNKINIKSLVKLNDKNLKMTIFILCIISIILSFTLCVFDYKIFKTEDFDSGVFTNIFYHLKHDGLPLTTIERNILVSHFTTHVSPILYLLWPVYFLFSSALTLEFAQIIIVFSGVIPLYKLCKHFKFKNNLILFVSIIYLFYPYLYSSFHTCFHENCFLAPLFLWIFYFYEIKKYKKMYLMLILTLLVKEDVFIYNVIFGLFIIFSNKDYRRGLIIIACSLLYFKFTSYYLTHYGYGMLISRFDNLFIDSNDMVKSIKALLLNPGYVIMQLIKTNELSIHKIKFILELLLPLGLLPIMHGKKFARYILILPMIINIITSYCFLYDINYQYAFATSAFLFYSFLLYLKDNKMNNKIFSIAISSIFIMYCGYKIYNLNFKITEFNNNKLVYENVESALNEIPSNASINASSRLVPHIANRTIIYEIGFYGVKNDVDYVAIDLRYENYPNVIDEYLKIGYEVDYNDHELLLLLKK